MENTDAQAQTPEINWNWLKKLLFRFSGTYLVLYILPFPLGIIPFVETFFSKTQTAIVRWTGTHILQLPVDAISDTVTGSGDRTFDFVDMFVKLVLALIISLVWTLVDRRSTHYRKHYHWLTVWVRYYLGFVMLGYGFAKVFIIQFPFPFFSRLLQPLGDFSPMGLAWTFMGYSKAFNLFTGLGEVVGGFLLFFRRTTIIGSFILMSVLGTVVAMNFSFDIPVKLFSTHLLLMAVFLLTPDFSRLYRFFISNETVPPADFSVPFADNRLKIARYVFKGLFIAYALLWQANSMIQINKSRAWDQSPPPLYGIYEVETFVRNQDTVPPLLSDTSRWRRLIIDRLPGTSQVQFMNADSNELVLSIV